MRSLFFALCLTLSPAAAMAQTFNNSGTIVIPDGGQTSSTIALSGLGDRITSLSFTLNGLSHSFPDDLVIGLLNRDLGIGVYAMSQVGGDNPISNATITFSDAASATLPASYTTGTSIGSGSYQLSNFGNYSFVTYDTGSFLSAFNGLNPNGTWELLVQDTGPGDVGTIAGGWSLSVTAVPEPTSWAMMILGIGIVGASLRRQKLTVRARAQAR
jgi:hypothetical protein